MKISVFGLGFVGLTTALGFSRKGYTVYGIEKDERKMVAIKNGKMPFMESGLDKALNAYLEKNFYVRSVQEAKEALNDSDCVFFCVGTPCGSSGAADLSHLKTAIDQAICSFTNDKFHVLVIKSTIPPSTTSEIIVPYVREKAKDNRSIGIANNPEFLREGYCWNDFCSPDRIVIGVEDKKSEEILRELYRSFDAPILSVNYSTAEFIKYLSNSVLATMISYANEMSIIADLIGNIDVANAFKILHMDKRWNNCSMTSYFYPGCGYGGYCLPKDTEALRAISKAKGFDPLILSQVIKTNENMPAKVAQMIMKKVNKTDKIGILGLSFKPNSDDVRETPSAKIIEELQKAGYENITAYDPVAVDNFMIEYPSIAIEFSRDLCDIVRVSDCLVIVTGWREFKSIKTSKTIIDCRYCMVDGDGR
ncbi:MAG: nucleotide sugar dehydrogenase [Holosporaceae bacterium]|nr:nucleotide sugar dehydrogenase [Holosporaceae bacterium]